MFTLKCRRAQPHPCERARTSTSDWERWFVARVTRSRTVALRLLVRSVGVRLPAVCAPSSQKQMPCRGRVDLPPAFPDLPPSVRFPSSQSPAPLKKRTPQLAPGLLAQAPTAVGESEVMLLPTPTVRAVALRPRSPSLWIFVLLASLLVPERRTRRTHRPPWAPSRWTCFAGLHLHVFISRRADPNKQRVELGRALVRHPTLANIVQARLLPPNSPSSCNLGAGHTAFIRDAFPSSYIFMGVGLRCASATSNGTPAIAASVRRLWSRTQGRSAFTVQHVLQFHRKAARDGNSSYGASQFRVTRTSLDCVTRGRRPLPPNPERRRLAVQFVFPLLFQTPFVVASPKALPVERKPHRIKPSLH